MATTGKIEGGVLTLFKDISATQTNFACITEASMSLSRDEIDVTCHQSTGAWGDFLPGRKSGSVSTSGYYDQSVSDYGADDIYTDWNAGTTITARMSTEVTGDTYYEFSCIITSLDISAPNKGEYSTFSASLRITGDVTVGTIV